MTDLQTMTTDMPGITPIGTRQTILHNLHNLRSLLEQGLEICNFAEATYTGREADISSRAAKVLFAEAVAGSRSACTVGELAKIITQNGFPIGRNRLFGWMRDNGYLGSRGEERNIPRQRYIDMGLFELRMGVRSGSDGVFMTTLTPKVTGKGQLYFINKFLGK